MFQYPTDRVFYLTIYVQYVLIYEFPNLLSITRTVFVNPATKDSPHLKHISKVIEEQLYKQKITIQYASSKIGFGDHFLREDILIQSQENIVLTNSERKKSKSCVDTGD